MFACSFTAGSVAVQVPQRERGLLCDCVGVGHQRASLLRSGADAQLQIHLRHSVRARNSTFPLRAPHAPLLLPDVASLITLAGPTTRPWSACTCGTSATRTTLCCTSSPRCRAPTTTTRDPSTTSTRCSRSTPKRARSTRYYRTHSLTFVQTKRACHRLPI
jgi:hypothetical protein